MFLCHILILPISVILRCFFCCAYKMLGVIVVGDAECITCVDCNVRVRIIFIITYMRKKVTLPILLASLTSYLLNKRTRAVGLTTQNSKRQRAFQPLYPYTGSVYWLKLLSFSFSVTWNDYSVITSGAQKCLLRGLPETAFQAAVSLWASSTEAPPSWPDCMFWCHTSSRQHSGGRLQHTWWCLPCPCLRLDT